MSDTQKHNKPNVPNLRFPEFRDEWLKYKLCDLVEFAKERISSSKLNEENYVSTENMLQDFQGVVKAQSVPSNTNVITYKKGNVLMSNIRPYLKKVWMADRDGGCSSDVFVMQANNRLCDEDFLHYIIANERFITYVMSGAKGVKMPRGDKQQMKEYGLSLPSLKEQQHIARFISLLDYRIAIQNKVIEKYESLIKAIYKNTLPFDGIITVPLGELVQICKGKQLNAELLSEVGSYYVMNGGVVPSGYYDSFNTPKDTITISEGGNSCGYVQFNYTPFWSGGHCYSLLKPNKNKVHYKFLYHFLKCHQDDIMALRIGSGLPNIQKKDIEKYPIQLPAIEIQVQLATLFDAIDFKKEDEMKYLNQLHKMKNFLLMALFI